MASFFITGEYDGSTVSMCDKDIIGRDIYTQKFTVLIKLICCLKIFINFLTSSFASDKKRALLTCSCYNLEIHCYYI